MARADTNFLKDITDDLLNKSFNDAEESDVISFTESPWGLNFNLLPAQKFILKCLYRMPLDNIDKYIPIKDIFCEETLDVLTEEEFLSFLIKEKKTNIVSLEKYKESVGTKRYNEIIICAGRRGSKCADADAYIYTTNGIITYGELLKRFSNGENIGINTYDFETKKIKETYDIIVEDNGIKECLHIETNSGKFERTTTNHPYLFFDEELEETKWVESKDLKIGDLIACSSHIDTFGNNSITNDIARMIAFLFSGSYITEKNIYFSCSNKKAFSDFSEIINKKFPDVEIIGRSWKDQYEIIGKDENNSLLNWLKENNIFGLLKEKEKIPDLIKLSTKNEIISFLNEFFSINGFVKNNKNINLNSININWINKEFLYDLQKILINLGINSSIKSYTINLKGNNEKSWRLSIETGYSSVLFCNIIGLFRNEMKIDNENYLYTENVEDIIWERISNIVNIGEKQTIAIEVKDTNVIVNSIITHNTNLSSVIAAYEIYRVMKKYNPQVYYGFPESEQIFFTCASVDSDGAEDILNKIKSRFFSCPILKDKQVGDGAEYLTLQTDYDIKLHGLRKGVPTIKIITGACSSNGVRGKNNIVVILDEIGFFGDNENSKFSGSSIYNALTPSCASFKRKDAPIAEKGDGLVVLISSPNKRSGIFWETYENSFKMPEDILMFQMYSALMNPTNDSNYLKLQYKKNPDIFDIEYGANFSCKTTKFLSDPNILYNCVDINKKENEKVGDVSKDYFLAVDLSYKKDATTLALTHKEDDIYYVDYINAYFPGNSDIWELPNSIYKCYNQLADYDTFPVDLIGEIIEDLSKRFMIKKGIYDQWSGGYPLETYLYNKGLERIEMTSFGPNINSMIVDLFETLLRDKKIMFWNCEPMLQEFLTLEVEMIRNNFRKVQAPQQDGFHDDIFDAISRSIYLCYINTQKTSKKMILGAGGLSTPISNDKSGYILNQMRKSKIHGTVLTRTIGSTFSKGIR